MKAVLGMYVYVVWVRVIALIARQLVRNVCVKSLLLHFAAFMVLTVSAIFVAL